MSNKLLKALEPAKKKHWYECEYENCHRKMRSKEARNLHHVKCRKRTDSDEDAQIYELSLGCLPSKQREAVGQVFGKNRLRNRHQRPNVDDDVPVKSIDKLVGRTFDCDFCGAEFATEKNKEKHEKVYCAANPRSEANLAIAENHLAHLKAHAEHLDGKVQAEESSTRVALEINLTEGDLGSLHSFHEVRLTSPSGMTIIINRISED